MLRYLLSFVLLTFLVFGCAAVDPKTAGPAEGVKSFAFVDGKVMDVGGEMPGIENGDTVLSLDLIREVRFHYNPKTSPKIDGKHVKKASYWIDEIKFY